VGGERRKALPNEYARALRKRLTPQEAKLWVKLRELKPLGFHFRRQAPIGRYIVDFASLKQRLIIEVDGGQHGMRRVFSQILSAILFFNRAGFKHYGSGTQMWIKI
jgi:very-short-patch-repair endonuclease